MRTAVILSEESLGLWMGFAPLAVWSIEPEPGSACVWMTAFYMSFKVAGVVVATIASWIEACVFV